MDRFCTLYVDTTLSKEAIAAILGSLYSGTCRFGIFKCPLFEVDIDKNNMFKSDVSRRPGNQFLNFPIVMEFEAAPETSREVFKTAIARIMKCLQADRCAVVAACDFEDELPQPAGPAVIPQRSSFLQQMREDDPTIGKWLLLASLGTGIAAAIYARAWIAGLLAAAATYAALSIAYAIPARRYGWPPLLWRKVIGWILEILSLPLR